MTLLELFGFVAVGAMVWAYASENRGPAYILAFAVACLGAAAYAAIIQAWPFAVLESIWSVIAFRRWRRVRPSGRTDS